jgi:glycosyltransferase involved in cell wall biosynthesis
LADPLRILVSAPVYWPAHAFGGPILVLRRLVSELAGRGHTVDVFTTSLIDLNGHRSWHSRSERLDGATVHYLATPTRFRWMGITPTLPLHLRRQPRPDVAHVFGLRDPLGTVVAGWCRHHRVPYLVEALGMYQPKLRKVGLKRALDATVVRHVAQGAARLVATSDVERHEYLAGGIADGRISIRPNGFPDVSGDAPRGELRQRVGLDLDTPLVLSVGRLARGKGLELLVDAMRDLPGAHLAIVGPDAGHGLLPELEAQRTAGGLDDRVHLVGAIEPERLPAVYADGDVFVLASQHENFGMVAAEAAAAGVPSVITDRCGVGELLRDRGALVVPYSRAAVSDALARLLRDGDLRGSLGASGREVAREWSWQHVAAVEEEILQSIVAA